MNVKIACAGLLVALLWGASAAGWAAGIAAAAPAEEKQTEQVFGPGKVQMTLTHDGRWLDFVPAWNGQHPLFSRGGILVFAQGPEDRPGVLVNTMEDGIRVNEHASRIRSCTEGIKGGFRGACSEADDDGDGRVNEDRLDGVDNDGDGKIDEDFAAIGDQMVATCYFAPAFDGSGAQVAIHQEAYAWALPHLDGTIMVSLWIKNIGPEFLDNVRIGAFMEKEGPFYLSRWVVAVPEESDAVRAGVVVCEDLQGTNLGMVVFPNGATDTGLWSGGALEEAAISDAALITDLENGASPASMLEGAEGRTPEASVFKAPETRVEGKAFVYQVSPVLGPLPSGEEMRVDLAFFAVSERTGVEAAAITALRTFTGDGVNRHLPPPVSITPRVIWGAYRPIENGESDLPGIAVELDTFGEDPVTAEEISYISGIPASGIERIESAPGDVELVLQSETIGRAVRKGERIIIKGRLENGEFFEAVLKPQTGGVAPSGGMDDATLFWKTEERLDLHLLTSSPNPFRNSTMISYEIPSVVEQADGSVIESRDALEVTIKVYNVAGRLVSVLVEEVLSPGTYTAQWNASDDQGNMVASGVYYVRMQIGKKYLTERLILLK